MKIIKDENEKGMMSASNEQLLQYLKTQALLLSHQCFIEDNTGLNQSFYIRNADFIERKAIEEVLKKGVRDGVFNAIKATQFKSVAGSSDDFLVTYSFYKDY